MEDNALSPTLEEHNSNSQQEKNESKLTIPKITEVVGLLSASVAVLSIVSSIVLKYISFGRCLYFYFDLDYYDFSLSNSSTFEFYLSVIAGIVSCIISAFAYIMWNKIKLHVNKGICKGVIGLIMFLLTIFGIVLLSMLFIPEKNTAFIFCALIYIFSSLIYGLIYSMQLNLKNKIRILYLLVAFIFLVLVVIAPICMKTVYDAAKKQKVFPIIIEKVDEELKYYVVISKGKEQYSTFRCVLTYEEGNGVLHIIKDAHKYFDINDTDTTIIRFDGIQVKETVPLSVNDIIEQK